MERDKEIANINIEEIIPNRFQPRLSFEPEALKELSESIKQYGIFQPLVVRRVGNKYEIIAGERRYKAATMAGFKEVPCIIAILDDNESAEIALVENLQRRDLTPIEEAKSYQKLLDRGYITQEQLAKRMGKSQSAVANKIRLLNLDEEVQQALLDSQISERHARSLLSLKDKEVQKEFLKKIIDNRMTVKDTDAEVKKMINKEPKTPNFIPIRDEVIKDEQLNIEQVPISLEELNNTPSEPKEAVIIPNALTEVLPKTEEINTVDIEKLTKSSKDINPPESKPDIMDLLRIEEVPNYEQKPATPDISTSIEPITQTVEEIPTVISSDLPVSFDGSIDQLSEPIIESNDVVAEQEEPTTEIENDNQVVPSSIPVMGQSIETPIVYDNPQQPIAGIQEEPTIITTPQVATNTYVTNNLKTAINTARDCVTTLEKFGFNVDKEELDLKDSYQIIIKIAKTDI